MKHRSLRFELDSVISFERVVLSDERKASDRVLCRGRPLAPYSCWKTKWPNVTTTNMIHSICFTEARVTHSSSMWWLAGEVASCDGKWNIWIQMALKIDGIHLWSFIIPVQWKTPINSPVGLKVMLISFFCLFFNVLFLLNLLERISAFTVKMPTLALLWLASGVALLLFKVKTQKSTYFRNLVAGKGREVWEMTVRFTEKIG